MPLDHSGTKAGFNKNVKTLMGEVGKSPHVQSKAQALAVAYSEKARGRAFGGVAPMLAQASNPMMPGGMQQPVSGVAAGGMPMPQGPTMGVAPNPAPGSVSPRGFQRGGVAGSSIKMTKGPIISAVPGRTDKHFTHVPSGSFVIPADIVSGHGEGNSLAGMNSLQKLFKMGPHASNPSHIPGTLSTIHKFAKGGHANKHVGKPVPVVLAGGEIVVPPENVHETMERVAKKKMTLDQAHNAMDQWVLSERKKLRRTLAKLPGPARD